MPKRSNKILPFTLAALASIASLISAAGCGDDTPDPPAATCYDYASFTGTTPAVSFKTDVLPIFRRSCGVAGGACHGIPNNSIAEHPYLGPQLQMPPVDATQAEIDGIFAEIVDKPSVQAPMTMLVATGKPELSYVMHKMDGTQGTCADAKCTATKGQCDSPMPLGTDTPLPAAERDLVRRWIAQGAKND